MEKLIWEKDYINKIICGDCLEVIKGIPDESIDLVVTSPPYNKGYYVLQRKSYKGDTWKQRYIVYGDFKDNLKPQEYIKQQTQLLSELVRVIKPKGSIFYNHKAIVVKHQIIFPLYVFNFNVFQIIIWNRKSTPQIENVRFFPTTEYIFWITKINIQPKFKKDNLLYTKEIWNLPVRPNEYHPAPFPIELPINCILATTDKNDIVLDPYIGIGTTLIACKQLNRRFLGIEINPEYCKIAEKRLKSIPESLFNQ